MKKAPLIIVLLALISSNSLYADGNALLKQCKVFINNPDTVYSIEDGVDWGYCVGKITSYKQSLHLVKVYRDKGQVTMPMLNNCSFDDKYSYVQMARVIVKYLEDSPEILHYWDIGLIDEAMAKYFPCK